ncbi:MAG: hypothetical protein K8R39_11620 [Arcobacteraceae bacterium]|nr:hypothetical protein [Arcobacteraceae bacterium]
MTSIDSIVNDFNIGFFTTINSNKEPINLSIPKNSEFANFEGALQVVSSEPYVPSLSNYVQLDGYTFDENNNKIPTKITLEGIFAQDSFLDKDGNWDEEAEAAAYRERELEYKKEVINDWLENIDYDLQSKAELMKALLAKAE